MPAPTLEDWIHRDQNDPETAGIWRRWCVVEMRREGMSGQQCRSWGKAQGLSEEELATLLWPVNAPAPKPKERDPIAALKGLGESAPALRLVGLDDNGGHNSVVSGPEEDSKAALAYAVDKRYGP